MQKIKAARNHPDYKKPAAERFADVQVSFDIFMDRLEQQGGSFHGGAVPDACDFKVYALIQKHHHTFVIHRLLEAR